MSRSTVRDGKTTVRIKSPADVLASVPALLGFQPGVSLVVIGFAYRTNTVSVTLRYDLPDPGKSDLADEIAGHAVGVLSAQDLKAAVAVGYGPGELVTPVADAVRAKAAKSGIRIREFLRAEDQRYWSYTCKNPQCCPPDGTPYKPEGNEVAAALGTGRPVLVSREELAATLAPVTGEDAESMHVATRRAEEHAARLVASATRSDRNMTARRLITSSGLDAVAGALKLYQDGGQFTSHNEAAWLSLVLRDLRVRDDAWARMAWEHRQAHLRLWTDLTRLARPGYAAPAASLLAFVSWQLGDGALANIALDRAQADDQYYSMASLLRQAIDSGAPPSTARLPMSPEQVAASYDELEAAEPEEEDTEDEPDDKAADTSSEQDDCDAEDHGPDEA